MISVVFLLSVFWLGFVLDERFALSRGDALVRFAAAPILGGFVATWLVYLLAWACGFTPGTILGAVALILAFNLAAARRGCDLAWAASRLTLDRAFWRWAAIFPALVVVSFACGLWRNASGAIVFFGNFTDLSYHMATVSAFIEQDRFPPLNPQSAAAKLSYHFMADFFAAILCRGGLPLYASLKLPMVLWSFSLGTLTCACFASVLRHRVAALCGATLFLFGHIGVFNLVFGLAGHPVGNGPLSWRDPATLLDHLAFPYFNFLNVVIDFFQPQLPFLFGFPLALLVLPALFRHVTENAPPARTTFFIVGLVALLPLFHVHSFLVLAPLAGLVFLADWHATRTTRDTLTRLALLAAAALAVGLQFAFILSQPKVAGFSGFDVGRLLGALAEIPDFLHAKRLWFWVRAAGLPFALGLAAWLRPANFRLRRTDPDRRTNLALLAFFAVTGAYFLTINFYRFTPNWGDSNKFFLYWDLALCLYAARWLATWWTHSRAGRGLVVALLLLGAVGPTAAEWALRLWRGPSILFTRCDQTTAEWIRRNTPRDAVFLTSNSVTHYVTALAGRRVINGAYTRETGFGDDAIEAAVARAYREADPSTLPGLQPDYIVVGPDERNNYRLSRSTLARRHRSVFELNCDDGRYSIYAVRPVSAGQIAQENADREARGYQPLSELDPTFVQQFGILRYDETFSQLPIVLDGKVYPSGLGTHAPSELHFDLDDRYTFFEADIGIDGSQRDGPGSVIFKIGLDDQIVYTSPILYAKSPHEHVRIPLAGAKTLRLIVDDAGDNNHSDHADWADAKLTGPR